MIEVYQKAVRDLVKVVYDDCAAKFLEHLPRCKHGMKECDMLIYSSLVQGLQMLNLWPDKFWLHTPPPSDDRPPGFKDSLNTLSAALRSLKISVYPSHSHDPDHLACNVSKQLGASVTKVLNKAIQQVMVLVDPTWDD